MFKLESVGIFQGDKVNGKISRNFLAQGIIQSLDDPQLNKEKVTIDMIEVAKNEKFLVFDKETITQDDEKAIITKDHFRTTRMLNSLIFALFGLFIIYLIYRIK